MKVYRDIEQLAKINNPVVTIGSFDGVHKGHQKIIARINELAASINGESVIITFFPHPRLILHPDDTSLKLLTTLDEKITLLEKFKVDNLVIIPFTKEFSELTANEFIQSILIKKLHPKMIVIGYNHHFGKDRSGDIDSMKNAAKNYGFELEEIQRQLIDDIAISSTNIRKSVLKGDMPTADKLLGYYFTLSGKTIKGKQIGKKIGVPTANIEIDNPNKIMPANGVYAVKTEYNKTTYKGMLNIGMRPTFNGTSQSIEVHIFDFNKEIYDEPVKVSLVARIREEIKFDTQEQLKEQLTKDKKAALTLLSASQKA